MAPSALVSSLLKASSPATATERKPAAASATADWRIVLWFIVYLLYEFNNLFDPKKPFKFVGPPVFHMTTPEEEFK
jgi:hypothetical protein